MAANKYLSLAGLTKYDAKLKELITTKFNEAKAGKVTLQVVESLASVTSPQADVIYLVPNSGSGTNAKDEYLYVNGGWELIGTTEVDLSGYATNEAVADLLAAVVENVQYDTTNKKLTKTIGGTTSDIVTAADIVADGGAIKKVGSATAGNFASLKADGSLEDSGKKATDFDAAGAATTAESNAKAYADGLAGNYATAAQGTKADTALQPADFEEITETEINALFP